MSSFDQFTAPLSVDLRQPDNRMDIVKGIEHINIRDEKLSAALQCAAGDWLVLDNSGVLVAPTATAVANTYPVWVGTDQDDAQATGQATILMSGGFSYRTNKFAPGSYTAGMNLTVKDLGGGEKVPSQAGGGDPVLARVYKAPDSTGVMEIEVLNR
jgi:hypothetical protein